jgi:hypothetical protein
MAITIPDYRGVRSIVPNTYDVDRRPGSGGQRYFTDMEFVRGPQLDRLTETTEKYDGPGQAAYEARYNTAMDALLQGANTRATNQQASLAAANAANPARQGLSSLQRVTDTALAKDISGILGSNTTDRQQIDQTIGYMNENAISPYRLSKATTTPLANIQNSMGPYYQTPAEQKLNATPNLNIQNTLKSALASAKNRAYGNPLSSIPRDNDYSPTEISAVIEMFKNGAVTSEQISNYFGRPIEEIQEFFAAQTPTFQRGGLASLGGNGYYLGGATDGMADQIPASINGTQEARLSDGEFVIPADVVSHLGNGNSEAGATQLHGMMDRIRKARTGTTKQGKEINPNNFLA